MKLKRIYNCIYSVAMSFGLFAAASAHASHYRGYEEANRIIHARLLDTSSQASYFEIGSYVTDTTLGGRAVGILQLLGTNASVGSGTTVFQNGTPNGVSMLLWYLVMNGIAQDLASSCQNSNPLPLKEEFAATLKALCQWPSPSAQTDKVMTDYWMAIMDFDAPEEELENWKAFYRQPEWLTKSASEVVSAMSTSLLLNPYFLISE